MLLITLLTTSTITYGQSVEINLSIEWKKEVNVWRLSRLEKLDSIPIPYLVVTYSNKSNIDMYAIRKIGGKGCLPLIQMPYMSDSPIYYDFFEKENIVNEKCNIYIDDGYNDEWEWWILNDSIDISQPHEEFPAIAVFSIATVNAVLDIQQRLMAHDSTLTLPYFKSHNKQVVSYKDAIQIVHSSNCPSIDTTISCPDITSENVIKTLGDRVIYLKGGTSVIQRFSLVGFYLTGGDYSFLLNNNKSMKFFECVQDCNNGETKFTHRKVKLPKFVGQYKLYKGKFKVTNDQLLLHIKTN